MLYRHRELHVVVAAFASLNPCPVNMSRKGYLVGYAIFEVWAMILIVLL